MFDRHLIRKINSGRCFALVGSGPSCEAGYPSWSKFAKLTYEELKKRKLASDSNSYEKYLSEKKYPEFFRQVERDLGNDREALVHLLKPLLTPISKKHSVLYEFISKWPFACYITTNYDDELENYLAKGREHFSVVRNSHQDFYVWRDGVSHVIQKLHSDLNNPCDVIITSADYRRVYVEDQGKYFRDRLCDIFTMFDILIIGHSLSDPDIDHVLQVAKKMIPPQHPIYMIAADFSKADEKEFLEKYNIVLVQYTNHKKDHSELRRMLRTVDRFIAPRDRFIGSTTPNSRPKEEMEAAVAIFLYRRLQGVQATDYLAPLVLSGLHSANGGGKASDSVTSLPVLKDLINGRSNFNDAVKQSVNDLIQQGLVSNIGGMIHVTDAGRERVHEFHAIRQVEMDQAYGQFRLNLRNIHGTATESQLEQCQQLAEEVIVTSFANRGSVVANKIFSDQSARPDELSDVFGYVSNRAVEINDSELRATFIEAMYQFLVEPNSPQRKYLASVSQGYFLYHLLGLDPKCCEVKRGIFQRTLWLCDSSVILPLLATGCHNHDYAVELFRMLADENALLYTTPKLLREAWEHLDWASELVKKYGTQSLEFLRATSVRGSYKQNLFLDGYIRLNSDGRVGTFNDYLELILPSEKNNQISFEEKVVNTGIGIINLPKLDGFVQNDWGQVEDAKIEIQKARENQGIYRSQLQVESEAEVWILVNNLRSGKYKVSGLGDTERAYFVSQSRIIDQVFQEKAVTTWIPEALYRYLSALPGRQIDPDLLQQCMLHEYYYAGISFIDKDRYEHFFGPGIDASKAAYEAEKAKYIQQLEDRYTAGIDEAFEKTPDLEKPFFVAQMGWRQAEVSKQIQEEATERALVAETRVRDLENERDSAWKKRKSRSETQEIARLRNLQDPKHLRKRQRQAKKRVQKKK